MDVNQVQINSFSHQDTFLFMKKNIKINHDEKFKEVTEVLQHHPQKPKETTEKCNENIVDFLRLQVEDVKEHVEDGVQF